jgi:hypothetical protein
MIKPPVSAFKVGNSPGERGQAMVLIAMAVVGLAAFMGLAIDAGILFTYIGHLRRATDSAALSAANQFREGQSLQNVSNSAREMILLNLPGTNVLDTSEVNVLTCITDASLCPIPGDAPRKLVRVRATTTVPLAFLPIIGFHEVPISADAISEAASLDLVLVIDTSTSMAYDGAETDPDICNPLDTCEPFVDVREAAKQLVQSMYFPYDRVSLVTFDRLAHIELNLSTCAALSPAAQEQCVLDELDLMEVLPTPDVATYCPDWDALSDPRGCMPTNTTSGMAAASEILRNEGREESVWVVILLSDGVANAAIASSDPADHWTEPASPNDWICPQSHWGDGVGDGPPYCQDGIVAVRHEAGDAEYDPDDAARDLADHLGCLDSTTPDTLQMCRDGLGDPDPGLGAVIFAIGLGDQMTSYSDATDPDSGAMLLRYIAAVGWDGDPATDPCSGAPSDAAQCGNYYFAETGSELGGIFAAIASRIFTRLTH